MRKTATIIASLLCVFFWHGALAEADRESLIEAWESYVAALPGTAGFEIVGENVYRIEDADLPYAGELRLVGALVRPAESTGIDTGFTHFGMVDFELVDLPVERLSSQSYYYWAADRQTLHYSEDEQRWVDPVTYQRSITERYGRGTSFGTLTFMLNYGIWLLIIVLVVFGIFAVSRQARKARAMMDETAAINQKARENIDRAAGLQDEVIVIAREARDLQAENNKLLQKLLEVMQR
ncbi:MAG: hypothetical protein OEN22_07810 [Gammaproteobacteria bacterium]|nr:hypothetical protein [Gammaproteobacteria bacterium]